MSTRVQVALEAHWHPHKVMVANETAYNEVQTEYGTTLAPRIKRTPLPAGQLAILLYLRFCESASTSVIFPFLDEASSYLKFFKSCHTDYSYSS